MDKPDDILVICFGTGQTTGAAGLHPQVKKVDSVELSSSVIKAGKMFADQNHNVLANPKVNFMIQDGRNHLLTTHKLYDVITSEPPPPRTAFTVNLYTKEYYELIIFFCVKIDGECGAWRWRFGCNYIVKFMSR